MMRMTVADMRRHIWALNGTCLVLECVLLPGHMVRITMAGLEFNTKLKSDTVRLGIMWVREIITLSITCL
jgi:hypothetical protein